MIQETDNQEVPFIPDAPDVTDGWEEPVADKAATKSEEWDKPAEKPVASDQWADQGAGDDWGSAGNQDWAA